MNGNLSAVQSFCQIYNANKQFFETGKVKAFLALHDKHTERIRSQAEMRTHIIRKKDETSFDMRSFKRSYKTMGAIFTLFCLC